MIYGKNCFEREAIDKHAVRLSSIDYIRFLLSYVLAFEAANSILTENLTQFSSFAEGYV